MRLTDQNLTMITGLCLALGVGVAGFFLRDNADMAGFAPANAAPSPVLLLTKADESPVPAHIPAHDDRIVLAEMPRLMNTAAFPTENPVSGATAAGLCRVDVSATPKMAAQVLLKIDAPCLPSTAVTIHHAGLSFREQLSPQGSLQLTVPAFADFARFEVDLPDGQQATATAAVSGLANIHRAAISWRGNRDIELQVNASLNHRLSPRNPRSVYQALMDNGGYMTVLGNPDLAEPVQTQIVTFFRPLAPRKSVSMALAIKGCAGVLNLQTARVLPGTGQTGRRLHLEFPDCVQDSNNVVLNNVLESMTIAQR